MLECSAQIFCCALVSHFKLIELETIKVSR
jgi:hypothetical protein